MTLVCPTDVVEAPVAVVWRLLVDPARWGGFYDLRIQGVDPPGAAKVGQIIRAESGPVWLHLKVTIAVTRVDPAKHRLGFEVRMPLGVTVSEDMTCAPMSAERCRVNYNCDFSFPAGWRGAIVRAMLKGEITAGPADSLARLKVAAERAYAEMNVSVG
jgi:hypothetical protein